MTSFLCKQAKANCLPLVFRIASKNSEERQLLEKEKQDKEQLVYKNDTNEEGRRLRAISFAIAKMKVQLLYGEQYRICPILMSQYWKNSQKKTI